MAPCPWLAKVLAIPIVLRPFFVDAKLGDHDGRGLFHFVTRPEIRAPKWNVTVHDKAALAPGFWFFGPYETLAQPADSGHGWIGPHIYDGNGDLVWSGAEMFDNRNIEDFRVSNVDGEDMMTLMWQERGTGVIMNNNFNTHKLVNIDSPAWFNSHEFHFVEDGARAIASIKRMRKASQEESSLAGVRGGEQCNVIDDGFREYDTKTWKKTFEWDTNGHVPLTDSSYNENVQGDCRAGWDYFHINSVDKTIEGDFWVSGRHTDALYKIDGRSGEIIWQVGGHGKKSDFKMLGDVTFARQHDVRIREQNETHTVLSILDNAKGMYDHQKPTYKFSRGLLISLNHGASTKTASIVQQIDHPHGEGSYAPRRGNYQVLDNGNIFMGWSERALQTEHTPDGKLIMEAELVANWLGTYRNYKFPFVGKPSEPPAVYSAAYDGPNNSTSTKVHVSWNGATEVATWNLYKVAQHGEARELVGSAARFGFETALAYEGYATYVVVEGLDKDGNSLGESKVKETVPPKNLFSADVLQEQKWLQDATAVRNRLISKGRSIITSPIITFILGFACSTFLITCVWTVRRRATFGRNRPIRYESLSDPYNEHPEEEELAESFRKDSVESSVG